MAVTKGEIQVRGILAGKDNKNILNELRAEFPEGKTAGTENTVAWYRHQVGRVQAGKPHKLQTGLVSVIRQHTTKGPAEHATVAIRPTGIVASKAMQSYIALIRENKNGGGFGVDFPDFPGCISTGSTIEKARVAAREALEMHICGMIEDSEALPSPSTLDVVMADPSNADAVAFLMSLPELGDWSVRVNITLPARLLRRIDAHASNRSAFLARAAEKALAEN